MAADTKDLIMHNNSRIWIHFRLIHLCLLFIIRGTICGFWICFTEIQSLRQALDAEIAKRTLVEFGSPESFNVPISDGKQREEYSLKGENVTPPYQGGEVIFTYQEYVPHDKQGSDTSKVKPPQMMMSYWTILSNTNNRGLT